MIEPRINFFSHKMLVTLGLFLIGSLHTMIFTFFQLPENYATWIPIEYLIYLKLVSYASAIVASVFHHSLCQKFGMKSIFIGSLVFNLLGLSCILLSWIHFPSDIYAYTLIFIGCISFGAALLVVINSLISYLTIEYPEQIYTGIIVLFMFLNLGVMLSPVLLDFFNNYDLRWLFIAALMGLLIIAIFSTKRYLFNPEFPKKDKSVRKNSLLWKDLHYRLVFFVLAIVFYGMVENTFNLWGEIYLAQYFPVEEANSIITLFWLFMILGQILILFPMYYLNPNIVFTALSVIAIGALWGLYKSENPYSLIAFIILGGVGCSGLFPLVLSSLGSQIIKDSKMEHRKFLPYIEMGSAYILAGYILGIGLIDLFHVWNLNQELLDLPAHFYYASWCVLGTLAIYLFLDLYAKAARSRRG